MHEFIDELILEYEPRDYESWCSGKREKWLSGEPEAHVLNQPRYHFGEYFVLSHYASLGWEGHRFYALGTWEQDNPKLRQGRETLVNLFETDKIETFRRQRVLCGRGDGKGEPDLFLRKQDGSTLFLEVKKDRDKVSKEQLQCFAQIRTHLKAEVGIVRLVATDTKFHARRYELDLIAGTGRRVDAKKI